MAETMTTIPRRQGMQFNLTLLITTATEMTATNEKKIDVLKLIISNCHKNRLGTFCMGAYATLMSACTYVHCAHTPFSKK
jgi:hypothetical protein